MNANNKKTYLKVYTQIKKSMNVTKNLEVFEVFLKLDYFPTPLLGIPLNFFLQYVFID